MPFTESIASILSELVTRSSSTVRGFMGGGGEVGGGIYRKVQHVVQSCVYAPTSNTAIAAGAIWSCVVVPRVAEVTAWRGW